jgi:branched-chain amino acid transport system substrate-binding protein
MKRISLVFGLIVALLAPTACIKKGGDNSANYTTGDIKVGVYADLTGKTSSFGKSTKDGITMASEEINAAGGIDGRKLVLVVEDDQGVPANAKTVVSKLITSDSVQAVLGEVASTNTLSAAPVAQEKHIPMITPSSTNPKVTQVGDYIFRVCFIDPFQGSVMAKFAANTLKAKKAAILGDVNSDYSKGLTQFFKEEFTKLGGTISAESTYTQDDNDFKGQLTAIRASNPDVIYIPGYYSQVGIIAKQARELGMNVPLLGGDGWDSPDLFKLGGDALANSYISNHYSVDDPSPAIQKFVAAYKKRFNGEAPDAIAALAYDSCYVLANAIRTAKTTEPAKLRDAIAATTDYAGVTGKISINKDRDAVKPAVVLKLDPATKKQVYQETINP